MVDELLKLKREQKQGPETNGTVKTKTDRTAKYFPRFLYSRQRNEPDCAQLDSNTNT